MTTLVTGLTSPTAIAVDGASVYVADSGCPVDGSGCIGGAILKVTPEVRSSFATFVERQVSVR